MSECDANSMNHEVRGSVRSASQITNASLSHTSSRHTTPRGSMPKSHLDEMRRVEQLFENIGTVDGSEKPNVCHCEPAIAALTDPEKAHLVLEKLEELHPKYETDSHSIRKETSTAMALRKHVTECLKITSVSASTSEGGPLTSTGTWSAKLVKKPVIGRSRFGASDSPSLELTVELPLTDILSSVDPRLNTYDDYRVKSTERGDTLTLSTTGNGSVIYRGTKRDSLPGFYPRSTLYKATGDVLEDNAVSKLTEQRKTLDEESITDSYVASLADLDTMPEGQLNWNKVAQLEQEIWKQQEDSRPSNVVRQGSHTTYMSILKQALNSCSVKRQQLVDEANEFYRHKQDQLTSEQVQKMAHFRLYLNDVYQQISLVENSLSQSNLFMQTSNEQELIQQRRWPLVTPMRSRERYARQVRVIVEMLAIMEELLEAIKNSGDPDQLKLFN